MDFREILNSEFKKRNEVNTKYSLRSFSNFLDLDTSTLSQILKGKRKIPKTHWQLIADKLSLSGDLRQSFLKSLIEEFVAKDISIEAQETLTIRHSKKLDDKAYFEIISDWEYAASLSLININSKDFCPLFISKKLGIKLSRAEEIFNKLYKYELVEEHEGKVVPSSFNFHTSEEILSLALQKAHKN
jgi:uncharacterized protein (TIGR02147 family)